MNHRSPRAACATAMLLAIGAPPAPGAPSAGEGEVASDAPAPSTQPAPPAPVASLDLAAMLEPIRAKADPPALWAGIVTAEGVTRVACVGVREAGRPDAAQPGDRVHLGSCAKSMTATLIALLVSEGKLRWEMTLAEGLPDLREAMDSAYRGVTLAQLCTHRAGLPADLMNQPVWPALVMHPGPPRAARRLLAEGLLTQPPASRPGTKMEYANAGFVLAGHVAETVLSTPYEELMTSVLFTPLGMTSAGFRAPGTAAAVDQPRGHTADGQPVSPGRLADNPPALAPAGTIHMSIDDWAKYLRLHLLGATGQDQRVGPRTLAADAFERLHTPPDAISPYAFGWVASEQEWAGPPGVRRVIWHNGSNTMWYAEATLALERGFAVVVVTNRGGAKARQAVGDASKAVIAAWLKTP